MENPMLTAERREEKGKSAARRLRRANKIPGVVYGIHESTSLTVDPKALEGILDSGANVIFQLSVAGEKKSDRPVMVKELSRDPIRGDILHADFLEIRMDKRLQVSVPIVLTGESVGVRLGGTLSQLLREIGLACLPNAIPQEIPFDVSEVDINDVVHVRDLNIPEGVDLVAGMDDPVLTVTVIDIEEDVPEEEEETVPGEEAAEEGAPPAEAEGKEDKEAPEPAAKAKEKK